MKEESLILLWLSRSDICFPLAKSWFLSPFKNTVSCANSSRAKQVMIHVDLGRNTLNQQIYSNCLRKRCILNIHCHCLLVTSVQRSDTCLKTFGSINSTLDVHLLTSLFILKLYWKYRFFLLSLNFSYMFRSSQNISSIKYRKKEFGYLVWEQKRWHRESRLWGAYKATYFKNVFMEKSKISIICPLKQDRCLAIRWLSPQNTALMFCRLYLSSFHDMMA